MRLLPFSTRYLDRIAPKIAPIERIETNKASENSKFDYIFTLKRVWEVRASTDIFQ